MGVRVAAVPFGVAAAAASGAELFLTGVRAVVVLPDRDGIPAVLLGVGAVAVLTVSGSQGVNSCGAYEACHKTSWGLNSCHACIQSRNHSMR